VQKLQPFIDDVLSDLNFCYAYINGVLVVSTTDDEHEQQLRILFQRFSEYDVLLNSAKYVSDATELNLLGYTVSAEGASADGGESRGNKPFPTPCLGQRRQTFPWNA